MKLDLNPKILDRWTLYKTKVLLTSSIENLWRRLDISLQCYWHEFLVEIVELYEWLELLDL